MFLAILVGIVMPHLRLYAVPEEAALAASEALLPKLADLPTLEGKDYYENGVHY